MKVFNCNHKAREPEEVTVKDCQECLYKPRDTSKAEKVILRCGNDRYVLCPGDSLAFSAAIYSLHRKHPGRFLTAVETSADGLFQYNPDIWDVPHAEKEGIRKVNVEYGAINSSNQRAISFMEGYCEGLGHALGVDVPLMTNRPHVFVSHREKTWISAVEERAGKRVPFWIVNAGYKTDFTAKWWGRDNYQRVIDLLRGKIQFVQIGSTDPDHVHPPLDGVINLIGQTQDHRQFVRLVWWSSGVLTPTSFLMHLAAALEKPSVVLLGGREPVNWNCYPKSHIFHSIGSLSCCRDGACWRSRTVKLNDNHEQDSSLCEQPFFGRDTIPKCLARITPEAVAEKILQCQE